LGKKGLFRKIVNFFFQGWIIIRHTYVHDETELTGFALRSLIKSAEKHVADWREFAVAKEDRFTKPVTPTEGYHWTELRPSTAPHGAFMRAMSLCVYNTQYLGDAHDTIYDTVGKPHLLGLTGTRRRFDGTNHVTKTNGEDASQLHWGAPRAKRKFTNSHTGVSLSLSKRWFRAEDIKKVYSPPE